MPLFHDEGVVLRTAKLGEADRIITMLTRDHGKIRAVAKGVRRVKSRFGARLEPFMRVDVLVATGRALDVISQAESISAYAATICVDYESYGVANVIVETADKIVNAQGERSQAQYMLLRGALNALAKHLHPAKAIGESYVMRAMMTAGWAPRLESCVVCGRRFDGHENMYFSIAGGGVMCAADRTPDAKRFDSGQMARLAALLEGNWDVLDHAQEDPHVTRIVEEWGEYYLERPIRSLRLLD